MKLINGQPTLQVDASDRGLQFGDGCFTTAQIVQGKVIRPEAHLQRLQEGCQRLAIAFDKWAVLAEEMAAVATGQQRAVLKVVISRGSGGRGYSTEGCDKPLRIVSTAGYPPHYDRLRAEGVRLPTCPITLGVNPALAGIKHLNRLEQVLIRRFIDQQGADEALVLDHQQRVVECCSANIFWRKGEQWLTPRVDEAGVDGTMRRYLIRLLAEWGYSCRQVFAEHQELLSADEVFICNALMPVIPVTAIDDSRFPRGELTQQLIRHCTTPG